MYGLIPRSRELISHARVFVVPPPPPPPPHPDNDITRLTRPVQVFDRPPSRKAINIIRVHNRISISRFQNRQIGYECSIPQVKVSMLSELSLHVLQQDVRR